MLSKRAELPSFYGWILCVCVCVCVCRSAGERGTPSCLYHSPIDGCLGWIRVSAAVNGAIANMGCSCLFKIAISFPEDKCPEVSSLAQRVALFLSPVNSLLFSMVAAPTYLPTDSVGGFHSLRTLSSIYQLQTSRWWPFWQMWVDTSLQFWFAFLWWLVIVWVLTLYWSYNLQIFSLFWWVVFFIFVDGCLWCEHVLF